MHTNQENWANTNVICFDVEDAGAVSVDDALFRALLVGHTHVTAAALLYDGWAATHANVGSRWIQIASLRAIKTLISCGSRLNTG